jgi:hypothetical protein
VARRRQWGRIRELPSGRYQARTPDEVPAPLTYTTKANAARWLAAAQADTLRGAVMARVDEAFRRSNSASGSRERPS